jgi:hypothetical protein
MLILLSHLTIKRIDRQVRLVPEFPVGVLALAAPMAVLLVFGSRWARKTLA